MHLACIADVSFPFSSTGNGNQNFAGYLSLQFLGGDDYQHSGKQFKGLFTWREGALANQAIRLEGLTRSPPLHATH